jgi:hypothetical protein
MERIATAICCYCCEKTAYRYKDVVTLDAIIQCTHCRLAFNVDPNKTNGIIVDVSLAFNFIGFPHISYVERYLICCKKSNHKQLNLTENTLCNLKAKLDKLLLQLNNPIMAPYSNFLPFASYLNILKKYSMFSENMALYLIECLDNVLSLS